MGLSCVPIPASERGDRIPCHEGLRIPHLEEMIYTHKKQLGVMLGA